MKTLAQSRNVIRSHGQPTFTPGAFAILRPLSRALCYAFAPMLAVWPAEALPEPPANYETLDAREAVREGNRLLLQGNPEAALRAYDHAEKVAPDRLEVPFVKGIGNYNLKHFEDARQSFERALLSKDRKLATDAQYGIGAAHHAEALALLGAAASGANPPDAPGPQEALRHLESAMQSYRRVLADHPHHAAAREADTKAAHLWRQVRRLLQEQQQQQQQNQKCDNPKEDSQDNENQQQQNQSENNEQQPQEQTEENQQNQSEENAQQHPAQSQEQKDAQEQPSEEQPQSAESNEEKQEEPPADTAQQEERESREQANRRLREMLQAIRDRQKVRREKLEPAPLAPVDKDW